MADRGDRRNRSRSPRERRSRERRDGGESRRTGREGSEKDRRDDRDRRGRDGGDKERRRRPSPSASPPRRRRKSPSKAHSASPAKRSSPSPKRSPSPKKAKRSPSPKKAKRSPSPKKAKRSPSPKKTKKAQSSEERGDKEDKHAPPPDDGPAMPPGVGPRPPVPASNSGVPKGVVGIPLQVSTCGDDTISKTIHGTYYAHSMNDGKVVFKKDESFEGLDVLIYYWDDQDSPELSAWWFGPSIGGDLVWASHPSRVAMTPPVSDWNVPHDGDVDPTFSVAVPAHVKRPKRPKKQVADGDI